MARSVTSKEHSSKRRRTVLVGILSVAIALVVACAVALLRSSHQVHRSIVRVQNLGDARLHLEALQRLMTEAESIQRGYLVTGLESHITAMTETSHDVEAHLSALDLILVSDARTFARYEELRETARTSLASLRAILDLASRGGRAASILATGSGAEQSDHFGVLAAELDARLSVDESAIKAQLLNDAQFRSRLILVLLAANVILVAGVSALAWHFVRIRSVAQIVSQSPTIEHEGEWITFETYLDRRFGVTTSRGLSSSEVAKLDWMRPPPRAASGPRAQPACRQSRRS